MKFFSRQPNQQRLNLQFWKACAKFNAEKAEQLLKEGAEINFVHNGITALQLCADSISGHHVLKMLLQYKPDVNLTAPADWTALMNFVKCSQRPESEALLLALIDSGADIHAKTDKKLTPLWVAIHNNNAYAVKILLEKGVSATEPMGPSVPPLVLAAGRDEEGTITQMLLQYGADPRVPGYYDDQTALHRVARRGKIAIAEELIAKGADLNVLDAHGDTPAMAAKNADQKEMVEFFCRKTMSAAKKTGWIKTGAEEIVHIEEKKEIDYCLTTIFNFTISKFTQIARNMKSEQESLFVKTFSEFSDQQMIDDAREELIRLGGTPPAPFTPILIKTLKA